MDQITGFLVLASAVWTATELLPRLFQALMRLHREALALILGPVCGAVAALTGLITVVGATGWKLGASGALGGLLATFVAAGAHSTVIKPATGGLV